MTKDAAPAPTPAWTDATKHLRDIARWITGGVVATAAAVATGSSLTRLGSLDPTDDSGRLMLAAGGLLTALGAIGLLMKKSLGVLNISAGTIDDVAQATVWAPLFELKKKIESTYRFAESNKTWQSILDRKDPDDDELVAAIERSIPYYYVREKFDELSRALPWCTLVAFCGLVSFAWAANPPEKKSPPAKPPFLQVNLP